MVKYNNKLPQSPSSSKAENPVTAEYPYTTGSADINGSHNITYANPDHPTDWYQESFSGSAAFQVTRNDSDGSYPGANFGLKGHGRDYSTSSSSTSDGHVDSYTSSSSRTNVGTDSGASVANDNMAGAGSKNISGSQDGAYFHSVSGDTHSTSKGNRVENYEGDTHLSFEGDHIQSITKNKHTIVNGELGIHVPAGNMDTLVSQAFKIEAGTSITFKVGSSTIVMVDGKITITSSDIEFVKA